MAQKPGLTLLVLCLAILAWSCDSDDSTQATSTTAPASEATTTKAISIVSPPASTNSSTVTTVFTWGNNPADWFSEDEMTDVLGEVFLGRLDPGLVRAVLEHEPNDEGWGWTFGGQTIHVHNVGDVAVAKTDPRLPQGVTYEAAGYGGYMLSGPYSDEVVCIHLWPPTWPSDYLVYPPESELEDYEDMVFALASMMLQQMRWAD